MSKTQKVWLWIFLALFVVPEALWSPVGNMIYELYLSQFGNTYPFRDNFLQNSDNINVLSSVLFIQLLGLVFTIVYLIFKRTHIQNKTVLWSSLVLLLLATLVTFFVFGLSMSFRNIGF